MLEVDIEELEKHRPFLTEFSSTGGWIQYYISWFASERSGGATIHYKLLERLAALQISLSFDIYSCGQETQAGREPRPDVAFCD